jgi:hypothetical protein
MPSHWSFRNKEAFLGGTLVTAPGTFDAKKPLDSAGQTYHGDHASVFYQIPVNPHKYPIVMLHGAGQFSHLGKHPGWS